MGQAVKESKTGDSSAEAVSPECGGMRMGGEVDVVDEGTQLYTDFGDLYFHRPRRALFVPILVH